MKVKPDRAPHKNGDRNSFKEIPSAHSVEGWGLDRNSKRFRVGYIQGIWWYEEEGFRAYRAYCTKDHVNKSFTPITHLTTIKSTIMNPA